MIAILNNMYKQKYPNGELKFVATKGTNMDKGTIEKRIIFERNALSNGLISFLTIDGIKQPTQLLYEMTNIP
jgi:hypothetical protein